MTRNGRPPAPGRPGAAGGSARDDRPPEASAGWGVRRIVVALDASPASAAAARTAARLAALLHAELSGLFVEDADLLGLSGLPFAIEVGTTSAAGRPLAAGEIERRLRAQAARARRLLEESALAAAVRDFRFEVVRGEVRRTIADRLAEGDLVSLGRVGTTGLARLGGVARALLAGARGQVLLLPPDGRLEPPVVAVFGEAPGARRALAAALSLLDRESPTGHAHRPGSLVVLLAAAGAERARDLEREARAAVEKSGHSPDLLRFRRPDPGDRHALARAVADARAHALLLPAESPFVRPGELETVVAGLDCTVLLVR